MKRTSHQKGLKVSKLRRKFHISGITFFVRECAFLGEFISMEKMPNLFTASTSILLQRFFSTNAFCLQEHKKVQSGQPFFVSIDAFKRTMAARKKGIFEYFHFFDVVGKY